ncbi:MAG TPA: O-antigen ligase family protein [Tepidiformaceae bacterium]|nr:O-antigen ligase family protein [Tepidiformaceae bacterium]
MGVGSLALPLLAIAVVLAIAAPHDLGVAILAAAIVLEPGAIDFTGSLAPLLYELPSGVELPLTMSPLELAIVIACASAVIRGRRRSHLALPWVAAAIPLAIAVGFLHGWRSGGDIHIAYNEARGLIFGSAAFCLAVLSPDSTLRRLRSVIFVATALLAAIVLYRYFAFVRPNKIDVPLEFVFGHEDSIMLGVGLVCGVTTLARPSLTLRDRILLIVYVLLVAMAMAATQRRAATLVGMVGVGTVGALVLTKRPLLVIVTGIPLLLAFTAYLGAYWNKEYGATGQPARAVRSQIDPTPRDQSSDLYRDIERADVIATVRLNRLLGVGFGVRFAQFQALPNLESFWPLQFYTPHQNILWLWLKLGLAGIAAFLALIAIALSRCISAVRESRTMDDRATVGIIVAATLLMYIAFATVDQALIGTRGAIPLAVALAIAFAIPRTAAPVAQQEAAP